MNLFLVMFFICICLYVNWIKKMSFNSDIIKEDHNLIVKNVIIDYTNYKGDRSKREILPYEIYFGSNEWHTNEQWLLKALDCVKAENRIFAISDIHSWKSVNDLNDKKENLNETSKHIINS